MNAARRNAHRRAWPRGLYEPRPGYYVWRSAIIGKTYPIGHTTLAFAKSEAIAANAHESDQRPGLVERLSGASNTMADLLLKMPVSSVYNTAKAARSQDNKIRAEMGGVMCGLLTVADCAELIEALVDDDKARQAEAVRGRLIAVCRRGMRLGWMDSNPAEQTESPKVTVKRGRLTLDAFRAIYAPAPDYLKRAMMFGLVLGADRVTIAGLQRTNVTADYLTYQRSKTKRWIVVPLALRLDAVGMSLLELTAQRTGVLSPYLIHHLRAQGQASAGDPVHPDTLSQAFTDARKTAGIPDEGAPTFHELRSLCKREYDKQGGVDTKALLGHAGARVSELYADARGVEPVTVQVTSA